MLSESTKNKLKGLGVEPEGMMQRLSQHIGKGKSFASPQDYAAAIQGKQAAGQPLSDPQTAREFQQIAPALFGEKPQPVQTEFPFNVGQVPAQLRQSIAPEAHGMLEALAQYQRDTPFTIPYAPGTPTIDQTKFAEDTRQFDLAHELALRQQAHKEWLDQQNLALQRARAAGGGVKGYGIETPWGAIDMLIATGADIDDVMEYVNHPFNLTSYKKYGVKVDEMQDYARNKYANLWQHAMDISAPPKGAAPADLARGFRQAEKAGMKIKQAGTWGMEEVVPKFTETDYQMFADQSGRTVEEIRQMDRYGWLDDFMKNLYRQEFTYE